MVMTVFTAAIDVLFANPNFGVDVIYRAGSADPGTMIRAIVRQPDRVGTFGETRIASETTLIDIRTSDVNAPMEGDTIEINGVVSMIPSEPLRDAERLIWTIEARPQ
jgi:DNA/RNA endonuclease YhcR with UshA esterase domain